jgi:hypothetical protein
VHIAVDGDLAAGFDRRAHMRVPQVQPHPVGVDLQRDIVLPIAAAISSSIAGLEPRRACSIRRPVGWPMMFTMGVLDGAEQRLGGLVLGSWP